MMNIRFAPDSIALFFLQIWQISESNTFLLNVLVIIPRFNKRRVLLPGDGGYGDHNDKDKLAVYSVMLTEFRRPLQSYEMQFDQFFFFFFWKVISSMQSEWELPCDELEKAFLFLCIKFSFNWLMIKGNCETKPDLIWR